jgi:endonuclease YncB( thermonuclease family)
MSRLARFDSSKSYRPSPRVTFIAGIFGLGLAAGGLVGVSIWERSHQTAANDPFAPGGVFERAREAARSSQASGPMPPLGRYSVDVLRVIDGDTFEARVYVWPGHELTTRVRLRGIDAPELKARCESERVQAEAALAALRSMLNDRDVSIWNLGPDKYFGRVVADAGARRTPDISAALLTKGVARSYTGGHRNGWCDNAGG